MPSYISSIKNWFKSDYHGRHLGLILLEIAKIRPKEFGKYLCDVLGLAESDFTGAQYRAEVPFMGKTGRRADLGVFKEGDSEPFILIEIKYFDKPLSATDAKAPQLDDYKQWKRRGSGKRHVLILSREMYYEQELALRRWDHLARSLRKPAQKSDLIKVLVDYLEEEGIVMQNVQSSSLQRYFTRLVCNDRNVGRASGNLEGPVAFSKVLKNLQMLSGSFTPKFKKAWGDAGEQIDGVTARSKVASIDFRIRNLLSEASDPCMYRDEEGELRKNLKNGGFIDVFAKHSLGHSNDYLRVEYGLTLFVPGSTKAKTANQPKVSLFATVHGRQIATATYESTIGYSLVTDKAESFAERVEDYLQQFLSKAISDVLTKKVGLNPHQRKALGMLQALLETSCGVELADAA